MTIYTSPESFMDPTPSPGERIGSAVGQGLTSGLQLLAQDRLEKMKQQRLESLLQEVSGSPSPSPLMSSAAPSTDISDETILALGSQNPNLARLLQSQKEARTKVTEGKAKREFERAKPILSRADERAEGITQKESSLSLMEDAVREGDLGFFSPDNVAEITGIEGLRTPKGAQFISAGKEYFLGSLKRAGSRPNQWIEQQIQKMLPRIGRSEEANRTVIEALKSELAIEKEQLDIIDRLAQEDEETVGYVRGNIGQRTRKELKKFADQEQKDLESRLRAIEATPDRTIISESEVIMIDPQGRRRAVEKKDVKRARQLGYTKE